MAPQNSTFRHENSLPTSDSEELSSYSPILPQNEHEKDVQKKESISSHAIAKGEEIPIWICEVPRYVTGITMETTCNHIIKALIADEIINQGDHIEASHDPSDYVITEKWRGIEKACASETFVLPLWLAWGIARDEVKFKLKINKKRAELPENIHQRHIKTNKRKRDKAGFMAQLLHKITKQGEALQNYMLKLSEPQSSLRIRKMPEHCGSDWQNRATGLRNIEIPSGTDDDDQLFLAIEQPQDDQDSCIHEKQLKIPAPYIKSVEDMNKLFPVKFRKTRSRKSLIRPGLPRNLFSSQRRISYEAESPHKICQFLPSIKNVSEYLETSESFGALDHEIANQTGRVKQLICLKKSLKSDLNHRCNEYKAVNEVYRTKIGVETCIDEVQECLKKYREEIISIEMELYKTRFELNRKSAMLNNLLRIMSTKVQELNHSPVTVGCTQNSPNSTVYI